MNSRMIWLFREYKDRHTRTFRGMTLSSDKPKCLGDGEKGCKKKWGWTWYWNDGMMDIVLMPCLHLVFRLAIDCFNVRTGASQALPKVRTKTLAVQEQGRSWTSRSEWPHGRSQRSDIDPPLRSLRGHRNAIALVKSPWRPKIYKRRSLPSRWVMLTLDGFIATKSNRFTC